MIKRTLYFGHPAYLSLTNAQMVIHLPANKQMGLVSEKGISDTTRTIPIEDIGFIVLDHKQVTITQALLDALLQNDCAVVTCNDRPLPSGLFLPLAGNTLQTERFRSQIHSSIPLKKQLWQHTIKCKIANQAAVLRMHRNMDTGNMDAWIKDVRSNDALNLEARAACYYWKELFPDYDDFTREQEGDFPNNLLNYGYAILRAVIARSLVCAGLLPTLGIHHSNKYNAYCLADDIMEPYRPYVDQLVLSIIKKHGEYIELTTDIKKELLSIPVIDVTLKHKRMPLMIAASQTATSLLKSFDTGEVALQYPVL